MSVTTAKAALAALLLNKATSAQGAERVDRLFRELAAAGHANTDLSAALFELKEDKLVHLEDKTDTYTPHSLAGDVPDGTYLTPIPKPKPIIDRYQVVWPLPALREWWKTQTAVSQPAPLKEATAPLVSDASPSTFRQQATSRLIAAVDEFTTSVHGGGGWDMLTVGNLTGEIQALGQLLGISVDYERLNADWPPLPGGEYGERLMRHRHYLRTLRRMAEVLAARSGSPEGIAKPSESAEKKRGHADKVADTKKKRRKTGPRNLGELLALKKAIAKGDKKNQSMRDSALEFTDGNEAKADALLRALRHHKDFPGLA